MTNLTDKMTPEAKKQMIDSLRNATQQIIDRDRKAKAIADLNTELQGADIKFHPAGCPIDTKQEYSTPYNCYHLTLTTAVFRKDAPLSGIHHWLESKRYGQEFSFKVVDVSENTITVLLRTAVDSGD